MGKFVLFLLKPGFTDAQGGPYFCPSCARVEGFLRYVPEVERQVDVRRIDFPKPRTAIVELLGPSNQGCPVLILDTADNLPAGAKRSQETGRVYIDSSTAICDFLGRTFGVVRPHP